MSYHIVSIDAPQCSLTSKDGQLICNDGQRIRQLPLEDVMAIVVTSFSAQIHSQLLLDAAKKGVAFVLCESFRPASLVLPANRSTDTLLSRAMVSLAAKSRARFWAKTLDAKCLNQAALALEWLPQDAASQKLLVRARSASPSKESACAAMFWKIFARMANQPEFRREPQDGQPLNSLLNYGYAVLLSAVLQNLFAVGLDPTFGIGHLSRERSTPLAYDLMEPFRPCVDRKVFDWFRHKNGDIQAGVTDEYRRWIVPVLTDKISYEETRMPLHRAVEQVARGFRRAVLQKDVRLYKPWQRKI